MYTNKFIMTYGIRERQTCFHISRFPMYINTRVFLPWSLDKFNKRKYVEHVYCEALLQCRVEGRRHTNLRLRKYFIRSLGLI